MFPLEYAKSMSHEDMMKIDIDDLLSARFEYVEPRTSTKGLVESIVNDIIYENKVKRCGFDCVHTDSEECFYNNYKEALMFYVIAHVDGLDTVANRAYARPILNAISVGESIYV